MRLMAWGQWIGGLFVRALRSKAKLAVARLGAVGLAGCLVLLFSSKETQAQGSRQGSCPDKVELNQPAFDSSVKPQCGSIIFEDNLGQAADPLNGVTLAATLPASQTFLLHSRPGSNRVIYLDFTGGPVAGTWTRGKDPFQAGPFDLDGSPQQVSTQEHQQIQSIYRQVAEDFKPFDVDVTTEEPDFDTIDRSSGEDQRFGTRVMITSSIPDGYLCRCEGLASLGAFHRTERHSFFQPGAFVFGKNNQGIRTGPVAIGDAVSHEVGHTVGLGHQSDAGSEYYGGHGLWAPLMGRTQSRPLSQWSSGEFATANTAGVKQDDIATITSAALNLVEDDYPDSMTGEEAAQKWPTSAYGEITSRQDKDTLRLQIPAGGVYIKAWPSGDLPNLDLKLSLYDSSGQKIVEADSPLTSLAGVKAGGLDAMIKTKLEAGLYYLQIDGVGAGNPLDSGYSDYGSLGGYKVVAARLAKISPKKLPQGIKGKHYKTRVKAQQIDVPGEFSVIAGSLPPGLNLSPRGLISGRAQQKGRYQFSLLLTDANGITVRSNKTIVIKGRKQGR